MFPPLPTLLKIFTILLRNVSLRYKYSTSFVDQKMSVRTLIAAEYLYIYS